MPDSSTSENPETAAPENPKTRRRRRPSFDLSLTQLVATGLAAITATVAASFLGVAGTVVGAALFSVLMAVGKELYSQSLASGRDRVVEVVPVLGRPGHTASMSTAPVHTARVTVEPATSDGDAATVPSVENPVEDLAQGPSLPSAPLFPTVVWKRIGFATLSVFVVVLAVVTGVEVVAGRPISDVVRGDPGQGTTFFGDNQAKTVTPPAPTMTVTVTPKVVVTTPTVTQTAPNETKTAPPTGTTTVTPTTTPSTTGSGSSTSTSPTATSSAR